jgi:hypothetical protein
MEMKSPTALLKVYRGVLSTMGLRPDDNGRIGTASGVEMMSGDFHWYWPDADIPRPDGDNWLVFNPALETPEDKGVVARLAERMSQSVNARFFALLQSVIEFAVVSEDHHQLLQESLPLLQAVEKVDVKTLEFISNLITAYTGKYRSEKNFSPTAFYLRNAQQVKSVVYSRVAVLSSPLLEYISEGKKHELFSFKEKYKIMGVNCRREDVRVLRSLWAYIFPNVNDVLQENPWVMGKRSEFGNSFFALTGLYAKVIKRIDEVAKQITDNARKGNTEFFNFGDMGWIDEMTQAEKLRDEMNALPSRHSLGKPKNQSLGSVIQAAAPSLVALPATPSKPGNSLGELLKRGAQPPQTAMQSGRGGVQITRTASGTSIAMFPDGRIEEIIGNVGGSVAQAPAQPVLTITGSPAMENVGMYWAVCSDRQKHRVEFQNGNWVLLQQPQLQGRMPQGMAVNPRSLSGAMGGAMQAPWQGPNQFAPQPVGRQVSQPVYQQPHPQSFPGGPVQMGRPGAGQSNFTDYY